MSGERTSKIAWGARSPARRPANGPNPEHPTLGGKRPGAGRPKGAKDRTPRKPGIAFVNELRDFGLDPDAPEAAKALVNLAVDRVTDVICERVPAKLAPSVIKGSAMIIEMLCRRIERGEVSIADAVAEASRRLYASKARALLLQPGTSPPADAIDAEVVSTTPDAPPPPTRQEVAAQRYKQTTEAQERRAPPPAPIATRTERERGWDQPPPGWNRA